MCDKHSPAPIEEAGASSRRRRIWELSHACHCPLVGVGLPLSYLRRLAGKVAGGQVMHDDYEIHVGAVTECASRNRLSEALQKEFERRYAPVIARFRAARTTQQVEALWRAAVAEGDVAGAFWAGVSHPRCIPELEEKMCRDIHMVQHQAGACARVDMHKFQAMADDNARLQRELARLQQRGNSLLLEKAAETERRDTLLMQARALGIGKDSVIDSLRAELLELQASIPDLEARKHLNERVVRMEERERAMRAQIIELKQRPAPVATPPAATASPAPASASASASKPLRLKMPIRLVDQSVLCVGGRSGSVATYRALIERVGAQFAHHDGGLEDNTSMLETSMAAADLVICQTGCISHSAYWRVKDYCKRNGKRCVFIDNPSISSLARGLQEVAGIPEA
jgi:hypothetical protein